MSVTQITDGMAVIRDALATALTPLVGTYEGQPRAYWLQAPELAPLPLIVYQPQAAPQDASFLNHAAASGLFTIKALAATADGADALLSGVPAALAGLTVAGYQTTVQFVRELSLPPHDFTYTAGLIYQVDLFA